MAAASTFVGDDQILLEAGADPSLLKLQGDSAPLELLTEFIKCLRSEEFTAAKLLCKKVLALEPDNEIAKEFLPNLEERIHLDITLPSESSSSDGESSEEEDNSEDTNSNSSNDSIEERDLKRHDHCCHNNHRTP